MDAKQLAAAYLQRASGYQGKDAFNRALTDANRAIRIDPRSGEAFFRRGDIYKNKNQPDHALRDFSEAIRLDPKVSVYFVDRSNAYLDKHKYDLAIRDLDEALRLDPSDEGQAIINRCNALALKGQLTAALADCQKGIQQHPNASYALGRLGFVYFKLGAYDDAISAYRGALASPNLGPYDKAYPLYGLGLAKLKKGDKSGAADLAAARALSKGIGREFE